MPQIVAPQGWRALGQQQISQDAATHGHLTVPGNATCALVVCDAAIRWRDDGVDPTASVGMPLAAGVELWYRGQLSALSIISQSGTAVVNVAYYQ